MKAQAISLVMFTQHLGDMNHDGVHLGPNKLRWVLKGQVRVGYSKKEMLGFQRIAPAKGQSLGEEVRSPPKVANHIPRFQKILAVHQPKVVEFTSTTC